MRAILFAVLVTTCAYGSDDDIAFEEELECLEECPHRYHRAPPPTLEEQELYREVTESHWPGKREDNIIDRFSPTAH